MTAPTPSSSFDWEAAGRQLGATLDAFYSVVITGTDAVATGQVAIGISRAQASRRRVALGDLFADSPPILALVDGDDPHGLVDSFLYGVSLGRIARPVAGAGQLYVMPTGSEAPVFEEMLPNPRWRRLTAGFHEAGGLLVLAVPAGAAHIEDLAGATDGVVLVGEEVPAALPMSAVIAAVRQPTIAVAPPPAPIVLHPSPPARERVSPLSIPAVPEPQRRWSHWRPALSGAVLAALIVVVIGWLAYRPLSHGGRSSQGPSPDTAAALSTVLTSTAGSTTTTVGGNVTLPAPRVSNPDDSTQAAAFAVELETDNSETGAIMKLQQSGKDLPAATFTPVMVQGGRWFKVISGAFAERADADSLLTRLRRRGLLQPTSGAVVRLPFAFLIGDSVTAAAVPGMVSVYGDRGQPVYALRQADGSAWLLVGAFSTEEESALYAQSLRASGITPVLVYRKGRTF